MCRRIVSAILIGLLAAAAFAPASVAEAESPRASVRVVAGLLTYRAAPGVADTLIVTSTASSGGTFDVVVGTANRMRAGAGCTRAGTFQVRCAGVVSASILLGDGNDTLGADSGALPRVVRGGSGNDRLFGGSGHDVLRGGAGNDQADAGVGDESILRGARETTSSAEAAAPTS